MNKILGIYTGLDIDIVKQKFRKTSTESYLSGYYDVIEDVGVVQTGFNHAFAPT